MAIFRMFLIILLGIPFGAGASFGYPKEVVAMQAGDSAVFIQSPLNLDDPEAVARWILVSDLERSCEWRHASWLNRATNPNGFEIEATDGDPGYFLSKWGVIYTKSRQTGGWEVSGQGTWIGPYVNWTRIITLPTAELRTQHLVWQGERSTFFNDPRTTGEAAANWYRIGDDGKCSVFRELIHSYGPFGIETVVLATGLDGTARWTLTTGRGGLEGAEETGNWQ